MKGRVARKGGGGVDMAEADEKDKPRDHTADDEGTGKEAEERKHGGRAKRKHGGKTMVGHVEGEKAKMHAGRKPRKAGGRTGSNFNPLSSAHSGKAAPGRKEMSESMD
jgi:hypothetical protein